MQTYGLTNSGKDYRTFFSSTRIVN